MWIDSLGPLDRTDQSPRRCLECGHLTGRDHRRGLCRRCYRDPEVRDMYPALPRGTTPRAAAVTARPWTPSEDARLIRLFGEGLSDRQLAQRLGRSEGSVCKHRQRLGLVVSPPRQETHRSKRTRRIANML